MKNVIQLFCFGLMISSVSIANESISSEEASVCAVAVEASDCSVAVAVAEPARRPASNDFKVNYSYLVCYQNNNSGEEVCATSEFWAALFAGIEKNIEKNKNKSEPRTA
jgi:hypothetical protein